MGSSINVSISIQKIYLYRGSKLIRAYPISTSQYGIGNKYGSNKTPLGKHRIYSKIGRNAPIGTIFVKRRKTGKIAKVSRKLQQTDHDFITTRILRLEGLEEGKNRGSNVDTLKRCVYIHGTTAEGLIGKPSSQGCVRMKNKDIVELFDLVRRGFMVDICR